MQHDSDLQAQLAPTPFVASWIGRARPADVHDPDPGRRASAWAHWAFNAMIPMTGHSDRAYFALLLPGRFYDPKGTGPAVRPHLEIPARLLERPDPDFPDRLAHAGNGLLFPWWLVPEVMAVKRALFTVRRSPLEPLLEVLTANRAALADEVRILTATVGQHWSHFEALLVSRPEELSAVATADFTTEEINAYFPAGADLGLTVRFDEKLRTNSRGWASRRVGVWQLAAATPGATLGVVTPRLTRSSLFTDTLFDPDREAPGALLVRGLLLRRLIHSTLDPDLVSAVQLVDEPTSERATGGPRLRAVVARVGEKLPEASVESAVHFLHTYPAAADAWAALCAWASARPAGATVRRAVLTTTEDGFKAAYAAAARAVRRAEEPERDDINVLLPLAWDSRSRVVRVTFSRPAPGDSDTDAAA